MELRVRNSAHLSQLAQIAGSVEMSLYVLGWPSDGEWLWALAASLRRMFRLSMLLPETLLGLYERLCLPHRILICLCQLLARVNSVFNEEMNHVVHTDTKKIEIGIVLYYIRELNILINVVDLKYYSSHCFPMKVSDKKSKSATRIYLSF